MRRGHWLRKTAYGWHCLISRSVVVTRAYVTSVAALARHMPVPSIATMMEWAVTGQLVSWKPLTFGARRVIVGQATEIWLHPHLGEFDQAALFRRHLDYEKPIFSWLERHAVDRYDAVVEIGANIGIYSVFLDRLIRDRPTERLRNIYSFEPSREAYARLLANLEANAAQFVSPFGVAISDATGFALLHEPEGHLTNGSLSHGFARQFSPSVRSNPIITLAGQDVADLFDRHPRVLLKIDAEGWEPRILAAMAGIIQQYAPDLLIEILPGVADELEELPGLVPYTKFLLTLHGAARHASLRADQSNRDWLLTRFPAGIADD